MHQKNLDGKQSTKEELAKQSYLQIMHVSETPKHLCKDRPFTKEVWTIILPWFDLRILQNLDLLGAINKVWRKARCTI